jgi:hypothetical protein
LASRESARAERSRDDLLGRFWNRRLRGERVPLMLDTRWGTRGSPRSGGSRAGMVRAWEASRPGPVRGGEADG